MDKIKSMKNGAEWPCALILDKNYNCPLAHRQGMPCPCLLTATFVP
jgi:hypothetical protein